MQILILHLHKIRLMVKYIYYLVNKHKYKLDNNSVDDKNITMKAILYKANDWIYL